MVHCERGSMKKPGSQREHFAGFPSQREQLGSEEAQGRQSLAPAEDSEMNMLGWDSGVQVTQLPSEWWSAKAAWHLRHCVEFAHSTQFSSASEHFRHFGDSPLTPLLDSSTKELGAAQFSQSPEAASRMKEVSQTVHFSLSQLRQLGKVRLHLSNLPNNS